MSSAVHGLWSNNLPKPLSSFVGRARECAEVSAALSRAQLLVLTGPGGAGKTRLAREVASAAAGQFPDGVWWVELAPLATPDRVIDELSRVLGVRSTTGQTKTQSVTARLASDRALVVLDNCEHVIDGVAEVCLSILPTCPGVAILATSRVLLGMTGESVWRVPFLALPETSELDEMAGADACKLFAERAQSADARFELTTDNIDIVRRICQTLDGLPLAIELAAARVRVLSLAQILSGLNRPFRMLTGTARGGLPHHKSLRASMEWSYALLAAPQRVLFRRLAVFGGSCSFEAVESVCADGAVSADQILDLLTSLADESLVAVEHHGPVVRYRMLETVRQYAMERLVEHCEETAIRERHLAVFEGLADDACAHLNSSRTHDWIGRLDPEAANLQAAIDFALAEHPDRALRMCVALTMWWRFAGHFEAGRRALTDALAAAGGTASVDRARALWASGWLARYAGDVVSATRCAQEALAMAEVVGDDWTKARSFTVLSGARMFTEPPAARRALESARDIARAHGDPWSLMFTLVTLGRACILLDDLDAAEQAFSEAALSSDQLGLEVISNTEFGIGVCAMVSGRLVTAREHFAGAVSASREIRDPVNEAVAERGLARIELVQGHADAALTRTVRAAKQAVAEGAFLIVPSLRVEQARALAALGDLDSALNMLGPMVASGMDSGWNHCAALLALAEVLRAAGDPDGSRVRAEAALAVAQRICTPTYVASALEILARLAMDRNEWSCAEESLHEALAHRMAVRAVLWYPQTFEALAVRAAGVESFVTAARLMGAAERLRTLHGSAASSLDRSAINDVDRTLTERLGEREYANARAEGANVSVDEVVGWLRRARGERGRPRSGWESLTPTELQVIDLVVAGLTNPAIAERMFISAGTVKVHLAHVFQKVGVRSRSELAALAVREKN